MRSRLRILHLTHNPSWFQDHFDFICNQLGHTVTTHVVTKYQMDANTANGIWNQNINYYSSFDAVFISHLASLSRIFLQNNWNKPLCVWLCFRFNHEVPDKSRYHNLILRSFLKPNVKFFAASEHDRLYASRELGHSEEFSFTNDIAPPLVYINNTNKVKIPCEDKFFVVSKHNETMFMDLKSELDSLGIPSYKHPWAAGAPDLRGVKGIIHIPYTFLTRGLYENLALENVFFIPNAEYIESNYANFGCREINPFFWDLPHTYPGEVSLAEWYNDEYKDLFVYWKDLRDLKEICESSGLDDLIADKKQKIREFNKIHNAKALEEWRRFLT